MKNARKKERYKERRQTHKRRKDKKKDDTHSRKKERKKASPAGTITIKAEIKQVWKRRGQ
jgi:hypothetical protein